MENTIDSKIEKALHNKDITKIMHKASKSFSSVLDVDEIYTCQINALWKSFKNFKPDFGTKFTTYLYSGVYIECLKELKFKHKSNRCSKKLHNNISSTNADLLTIEIMDEVLNQEEFDLLRDKISNMTINEMSVKRDYSRETVRKKLKKISNRIKDKFN